MNYKYEGLPEKHPHIEGQIEVTFKCGHTKLVDISEYGYKSEDRFLADAKKYRDCPECEKEKNRIMMSEYDEIAMSYSEYKRYYPKCPVLKNSYDDIAKTVVAFVPKDMEYYKNKAIRNDIPTQKTHIFDITKQLSANSIQHNMYYEKDGKIFCETSTIQIDDSGQKKIYIESEPYTYQIDHTNSLELFRDICEVQYKSIMTLGVLDCFKERHKNIIQTDYSK